MRLTVRGLAGCGFEGCRFEADGRFHLCGTIRRFGNSRSVCTARPGRSMPGCSSWRTRSANRSQNVAGRWFPVGNVSAMARWRWARGPGGGRTVGVIPKALVHRELADVDADELIVTDTMRQRKQVMEDRSDAFVTLPGGIGTLEELFETWTAGYLGNAREARCPARPDRPLRRPPLLADDPGRTRLRARGRRWIGWSSSTMSKQPSTSVRAWRDRPRV